MSDSGAATSVPGPAQRWRLRPMVPADVEAVADIELRSHLSPWTAGSFSDSLAAGHLCVVLENGARILAYGVLMPGAGEAEVLNLTVEPGWRRRGLASRLLAALVERARGFGAESLWLEVRVSNLGALALYRAAGFVESGRRKGYYAAAQGREDALLMRCHLPAGAVGNPVAPFEPGTHGASGGSAPVSESA